jgi:uncharacterized membrane protein
LFTLATQLIIVLNNYQESIMKKTLSFAAVHFTVAFSVGYAMTGSLAVGGAIALVEPACNTLAYFFHEKLWQRVGHESLAHVHHA